MEDKEEILDLLYAIGWDATPSKGINALYKKMSDILVDEINYAFWDDLLESVDVGRASSYGLVSLLRRLYPMSMMLGNWSVIVKAAERELNSRDLDGEEILRGLKNE